MDTRSECRVEGGGGGEGVSVVDEGAGEAMHGSVGGVVEVGEVAGGTMAGEGPDVSVSGEVAGGGGQEGGDGVAMEEEAGGVLVEARSQHWGDDFEVWKGKMVSW